MFDLSFKTAYMKKLHLLPHSCRSIGYVLLVPFLAMGIAYMGWGYELDWLQYNGMPRGGSLGFLNNNFTDEVACVGFIVSLILIAFSKEKIEDEAIQFFRLEALQWAVYANYLVLILSILLCYGSLFFNVMTYNMFTILILFIIRFRFVLYQHTKTGL